MPIDPVVFDTNLIPRSRIDVSLLGRPPQTDRLEYLDGDDVDNRFPWDRRAAGAILAGAVCFRASNPARCPRSPGS